MKKSAKITLTAVAAMGIAACNRERRDPCEAATFDEMACNEAVRQGGYHYGGSWVPMYYHYPYPYYYDSYRSYTARGGRVTPAPSGAYRAPSGSGISRGGFGSIGAGHSFSGGS
jgi:hypothetical protein